MPIEFLSETPTFTENVTSGVSSIFTMIINLANVLLNNEMFMLLFAFGVVMMVIKSFRSTVKSVKK